MSRGDLQEMEVGTKQSKTAVNAGAKAAEGMPKLTDPGTQLGSVEDLGGPTPENYRSDDDSAKLKTPGATLKQVRDVVNKGAKSADAMKAVKEEEDLEDEEVIAEAEVEETEEVVEEETQEYDIEEDVNALLGGEELSEEFKEKAKTIFEAALTSKVGEIKEALEAQYEEKLVEEVEAIKEALAERVDSYLEYVADEWMQENALAVEYGIKEQLSESFLSGMRNLFENHYVQLPEEKYDVLENMVEKLDEMETKLNEQIERNIQLNRRLSESVADRIFDVVSDGLAITQKEKLASLAESVEFESEQEYREKLETLKESYFPTRNSAPIAQPETLSEGVVSSVTDYSPAMDNYMKALSMLAKN